MNVFEDDELKRHTFAVGTCLETWSSVSSLARANLETRVASSDLAVVISSRNLSTFPCRLGHSWKFLGINQWNSTRQYRNYRTVCFIFLQLEYRIKNIRTDNMANSRSRRCFAYLSICVQSVRLWIGSGPGLLQLGTWHKPGCCLTK